VDENKLQVLRNLPYKVLPCCGMCENAWWPNPKTDWGTCDAHQYEHQKHTGGRRQLSIYRYGTCPKFKAFDEDELGAFKEFVQAP